MPAPIIAAGIGAASTIGGALFGRSAQNHAVDSQRHSNDEALKYAREQDAFKLKQEQDAKNEHDRRYAAYMQTYYPNLYHNTYPSGYNTAPPAPNGTITNLGTGGNPNAPVGSPAPAGAPMLPPGGSGMSLGAMMDPGTDASGPPLTGETTPDATAPRSLADMGNWSKWSRYGVGN